MFYRFLEGKPLPDGLTRLSLGGGTLPAGTVLPDGLMRLWLDGGTLPAGTVLPARLKKYDWFPTPDLTGAGALKPEE